MSKSITLLVMTVVMTAAITGLTFLIPVHDSGVTCMVLDNTGVTDEVRGAEDSAPTPAVEKGFPLQYYQEPFPSNCVPADDPPPPSFKAGNLVGDLLMWTPLAFLMAQGLNKARTRK